MGRWLWLIVVGGTLLRLALVAVRTEQLSHDPDMYREIGRNLAAGNGFSRDLPPGPRPAADEAAGPVPTAYRPPLYPLLVAATIAVCGRDGFSAWLLLGVLQALLGGVIIACTARIAEETGGAAAPLPPRESRPGLVPYAAALITALDPLLLQYSTLCMTETLATALAALWLASLVRSPGARVPCTACAQQGLMTGACFGLLCLCRPTFLPIAGLCLFEFVRRLRQREGEPAATAMRRREWGQWLPAAAAAAAAVLAPWTVRNGMTFGVWTPATTHGGYTLLLGNNEVYYREVVRAPFGRAWEGGSLAEWKAGLEAAMARDPAMRGREQSEPERDRWMNQKAWGVIARQPVDFLRAACMRWGRLWDVMPRGPDVPRLLRWAVAVWTAPVLLLAATGMVRQLRRGAWSGVDRAMLALLTCAMAVHAFYWTDTRMRAPLMPALALLAARGLDGLVQRLRAGLGAE